MGRSPGLRYGDTAVFFHWIIAFLIIGLLAVGKFMTQLEENDPLRFELTQWHKSFGISVLVLSVLRILWRITHKPPPELDTIPAWQQKIANTTHWLLYGLMFALPVTGWIMVSASPLNIDTILFGLVEWPHLPLHGVDDKESLSAAFHKYHEWASTALILLLLAHIGAALKHHFIDKDTVLRRMLPELSSKRFWGKLAVVAVLIAGSSLVLPWVMNDGPKLIAGDSEVSFIADVTGEETLGVFTESSVTAEIEKSNLPGSSIVARVQTASVVSDNDQVAGSLPDADWFDVESYPEAVFQSTAIELVSDGEVNVTGDLTLKATTQSITFPMTLAEEDEVIVARGEFAVDRREYDIGMQSQDNDDFVGFNVIIKFRFDTKRASE